jgi:hypothetical protein
MPFQIKLGGVLRRFAFRPNFILQIVGWLQAIRIDGSKSMDCETFGESRLRRGALSRQSLIVALAAEAVANHCLAKLGVRDGDDHGFV